MAGKSYVTKGYSTYTNIPAARRGGYDHGSVNQYAVDTKSTERVHAPAADFVGPPARVDFLKEYVRSPSLPGSPKYSPTSQFEDYGPNNGLHYDNLSPTNYHAQNGVGPNKNPFSRRVNGYPSDESDMIHSGQGLEGARHVRTGNNSGPNKSWLGPPPTHHPLTTPTNNINEALGFLEESVYYSPRADPRRRGVLDDLSTRAQPLEPQSRYARPAFVAKTHDARHCYNTGSNAYNHEAMRRYVKKMGPETFQAQRNFGRVSACLLHVIMLRLLPTIMMKP